MFVNKILSTPNNLELYLIFTFALVFLSLRYGFIQMECRNVVCIVRKTKGQKDTLFPDSVVDIIR